MKKIFGVTLGILTALFRRPPRLVPWSAVVRRDEQSIVVDPGRLDPEPEH